MKFTKGVTLFLFLMILTIGMVGAVTADTAQIYADTTDVGVVETGVTYTLIPVNVSASGQKLTGFTIDIPQLENKAGNAYANITVTSKEDPDEAGSWIIVKAAGSIGEKGSYEWNPSDPNRVVWYYSKGVTLSKETTLFYLNVTVNASMKYPGSSLPINVIPTEWSVDGSLSQDKTNVTKYITVNYPASEVASVEITAPTYAQELAYKATGTAAATVKDQYGEVMQGAALTWSAEPDISINETTGAYTVISCANSSAYIFVKTTNPAISDKVVVQLTKATPTANDVNITVPSGITYDGNVHTVTAEVKSDIYGMGAVTVLYDGQSTAPATAGSYPITLNIAEGANYTAVSSLATGKTLVIGKASPSVDNLTYNLSSKTYDGTAKSVSVTAKDGVLGLGTITVKYAGQTTAPVSAGTYAVTADIAEGTNYTAVTDLALGNFIIEKATPTAADFTTTPAIADVEYDGQQHAFTVSSTKITDGTMTVTYNGASEAPSGYGTYLVNVSLTGATNYNDTANINLGQFNITKTWPKTTDFTYTEPSDLVYDKNNKSATVSTENTELQGNFTVQYLQGGIEVSPIAVGTYTVNVTVSETTNYAAKVLTLGSFTITPKSLDTAIVTLNGTDFTYNGAEQSVSVTKVNFTDAWVLETADYAVTGTQQASAAGTYTVTVTGNGNYTGSKAATWTINPVTPVAANFTASNASGPVTFPLNADFDNSEHTVNVTAAPGVYGMGAITVSYKNITSGQTETPKKVGSYYVNISVAAGANYTAASDIYLGDIKVNTKSYTITYETNGGSAIADETYNAGVDTKDLNTTTAKTGYHLDGWYPDAGFIGAKVTQITLEDHGDKTFYAKWLNNTYKVSFDKNSTLASGTMADQDFTYDAAPVALTANAFARAGYTFANWTNATDGTGVLYADQEAVQNLNETNGGITTLYAIWKPITYFVHFEGNGNTSGSMADQEFVYDVAANLNANGFVRAGYDFYRWGNPLTGETYTDEESVMNLTAENGSIINLRALWMAGPAKEFEKTGEEIILDSGYVVSSINVSGTGINSVSFAYDQYVQAPTRSGYHDQEAFGDAFNITITDGSFNGGKAKVIFNISKSDLGTRNPENIVLAHYKDTAWEYLKTNKEGEDDVNVELSAETTSFSPFYPMYMVQDTQYTPSKSSKQTGSTVILSDGQAAPTAYQTVSPTANPTAAPTDKPATPTVIATAKPTTQPTQQSPAPFLGIIAGLGAVAVVLRLRK